MALVFRTRNVATAKLHETGTSKFISTPGVTPSETAPSNYATQINKMLTVGGKSVSADTSMTVTQLKEVFDNGE